MGWTEPATWSVGTSSKTNNGLPSAQLKVFFIKKIVYLIFKLSTRPVATPWNAGPTSIPCTQSSRKWRRWRWRGSNERRANWAHPMAIELFCSFLKWNYKLYIRFTLCNFLFHLRNSIKILHMLVGNCLFVNKNKFIFKFF